MDMRRSLRLTLLSAALCALAACGGGGGSGPSSGGGAPLPTPPRPSPTDIPQTDAEAARFLTQATFGPTRADIARVRQIGYGAWIDEQLDPQRTPVTLMTPHILSIPVASLNYAERRNYWIWQATNAPDQLRMRMAFALSEIFVVSDRDYNTANFGRISDYQDTLAKGAFASYRQLVEQVTLHPAMGTYLSHIANRKATSYVNGQGLTVTIVPDENYARELMQLFSIGLVERNPDFSVRTNAQGQPIPTYDQSVITAMARVLTGWTWYGNTKDTFWRWGADNESRPMTCVPEYHDDQPKTIFRGIVISELIEPDLPRIWADERAIRQIALNLLTNAIKFTPQGGNVTIKVGWTSTGGQYFSVRDTGPGIPESEIPVVLSSFGRGTLAQKNADEGSGLGLPIVKEICVLHGGDARVENQPSGGARVTAWVRAR